VKRSTRDGWFVSSVAIVGLCMWLTYCAVQPHNFWSRSNPGDARATLFGWAAPGVRRDASSIPDRIWIVILGWPLLSFVAGWLRPRLWIAIGVSTVVLTMIVYVPTSPRDLDGLWGVGAVILPFSIVLFALVARLGGKLRVAIEAARHVEE
jgi:hypothetical protein